MSTTRRVFPEVFKRSGLPMKFGFVDEHRHLWPVRVMCTTLGLSVSGYYAWRCRRESPRAAVNRVLLEDIRRIHGESSGTYGSPRVHAVLRRRGRRIGRCRIERLMRQAGLRGLAALPRRTRTTNSRHTYPIAPNRLGRNFVADRPGQVWLADLTYIPTGEGWLYLAAVLDLHTRKIIGWSMRETLHTEIALEALTLAIMRQRLHLDGSTHSFAFESSPGCCVTGAVAMRICPVCRPSHCKWRPSALTRPTICAD